MASRPTLAVIMITYNEAHNMRAVFDNLYGLADEVFVVDSYSTDETVDIAIELGATVHQRKFDGFGSQWNYALDHLPVKSDWTMKLDPDERFTDELKESIRNAIGSDDDAGYSVNRRLWFMGSPLPIRQEILRIWKTGTCRFTDVKVNEHPVIDGQFKLLTGDLEHHDSPDLHHWVAKQNNYTTAEAVALMQNSGFGISPRFYGSSLERRMWAKKHYSKLPFRHFLMFLYCYVFTGAWKGGKVGFIWAKLRSELYRMIEYKKIEMKKTGQVISLQPNTLGKRHKLATQAKK